MAAFVRSIILISGDVADAASGAGDEALRVRKLNGDVALALCRREVEGMVVIGCVRGVAPGASSSATLEPSNNGPGMFNTQVSLRIHMTWLDHT